MNELTDALFTMRFQGIIKYYVTVDVTCTSDKVLESVEQFNMFIHLVFVHFGTSRENIDSEYLALLNTHLDIRIGRLKASLFIENDWKSTHLPQLINFGFPFGFPFYYCKDVYLEPFRQQYGYKSGVHVFMIDKFLLCPQISLNHTEYHILDRSNKLHLQNVGITNARLDYTVENNDDVRVCVMEYHAILLSSSDIGMNVHVNIVILIISCVLVSIIHVC